MNNAIQAQAQLRGAQEATRIRSANAAGRAELKRAHVAALKDRIRNAAALFWPDSVIPPLDGGWFFKTLAEITGETEGVLADLARKAGLWVATPADVQAAVRERADR